MPECVCRGGRTRRHIELREDIAHVAIHRPLAEHEPGRHLPVREPGCDEPQHFELTRCETSCRGARPLEPQAQRIDVREIRPCLQALEDLARGLELELRALLVAERPAPERDRYACSRCEIRRAELLPEGERAAQCREGRVRVALDELDLAARM